MARYKDSLKNYREEKNRWDSLGKKRSETPEPEQPPLKMFLIAGDNSGTGILENLIEASRSWSWHLRKVSLQWP